MPIRMVEQRYGLYFYMPLQLSSLYVRSSTVSNSHKLWHVRLGHPSDLVVNKFLGQSSFNVSKDSTDKPCTIFLCVKQTHDSFLSSTKNASGIFELIHFDL